MKKVGGNILAETYGKEKRWVNWRLEERKGKQTKVPYSPLTGELASSTDSSTWGTHKEAFAKDPEHRGIVFTPAQDLLGIDIDHCIEDGNIIGEHKEAIEKLLEEADTYTEFSPSLTGLHLYLALSSPLKLTANKHAPFEAYTSGRYFTTTNQPFGTQHPVRTVTPERASELLSITGYPWGKGEEPTPDTTRQAPLPSGFDDTEILERMFASKNGLAIKNLYDGDLTAYNKDGSAADMAMLSHFAFWTGKNAGQMEKLWLASPLGRRKKTQQRADYRMRSITAAISYCKEVYTPPVGVRESKELDLLSVIGKDKKKIYIQNTENMCRILRAHPDFTETLRLDMFRGFMERKVDGVWRALEDSDALDIQTQISIKFAAFRKVGKEMIFDAITLVAKENRYDSAADYIKGLTWDKTPRLDAWLSSVYGAPNDLLHQKIGSNWLKGMVNRIIFPGSKFDYVLVLEGEQGIRKSTSLAVLAGSLGHVETTMSTETKDFFMQFLGNAIVEFSEGETLSRTEVKRMKALITVQTDKFRPPYGRNTVDNPRRCVFAMTTNQTEYLKDETGNRRWLPVAVAKVADVEWLAANRDQLFAEAYYRLTTLHETTYEFPDEEMVASQNARRIHDPNSEAVLHWYINKLGVTDREAGITVYQAFRDALNTGFAGKMTRYEEMSMAEILKTVLNLDKKNIMIDGIRAMRWFPTLKTPVREVSQPVASSMSF